MEALGRLWMLVYGFVALFGTASCSDDSSRTDVPGVWSVTEASGIDLSTIEPIVLYFYEYNNDGVEPGFSVDGPCGEANSSYHSPRVGGFSAGPTWYGREDSVDCAEPEAWSKFLAMIIGSESFVIVESTLTLETPSGEKIVAVADD